MRKEIIPIILTTILLTITTNVQAFTDTEGHWAKESIEEFNKAELIKGYEDNLFKPNSYITRAEVTTIINRMNGVTKESSKYIPDITRDDWYYSDIRKAVQSGIMQGDENGYTNPNAYITREEAVVMIARAFKIEEASIVSSNFKDENEISNWAQKTMNTFTKFGYITGYDDNTIRPKSNITRAELVTIINRLFAKIATTGIYEGNISGNMLVTGKNVVLNNIIINGNLIIAEGTKETLVLKDVEVKGNLILREEINTKEIFCIGKKILLYIENSEEINNYKNEEYGIEFSISGNSNVVERWKTENVDYSKENLIIIDIVKDDDYYLKGINTIVAEALRDVDNIYNVKENGKIKNANYILFEDLHESEKNKFLIIKRDNVIYKIIFNQITTLNLVDNVIGTLNLYETETVHDRESIVYKNNKLNLKFIYREGYIGVDDSYNTNNIYSGDAPLKVFIQVNSITDIQNYSFEEVIYLLKTLAKEDGNLEKTEKLKVLNRNAVKFKISSEEKLMYSLYIVDGNILYNFIFMGDSNIMNEIGEELFNEIINNIEI